MRQILLSSILIFSLCCIASSSPAESSAVVSPAEESTHKVLLDDFDAHDLDDGWSFSNGPEFPGASGSFKRTEKNSARGKSGELLFDFSQGGNYVSAILSIPSHLIDESASAKSQSQFGALQLDVKRPQGHSISIRYTDQTGQVFQKSVDCPADKWAAVIVPFQDWQTSWGGENDGKVHGDPQKIAVLIDNGDKQQGSLYIDNLTLLAGSPDDWMIHTQYTAYQFEPSEGWRSSGAGDRGSTALHQKKWRLDFTQGAPWLSLRVPDETLLGGIDKITLRVRGDAKNHPVRLFLRTHFMTFHKMIGTLMEGDQALTTDGPPGNGWEWHGGENDGKIHGPMRLAEIRVENNGQNNIIDLELLGIDVQASCAPQKQCVLTAEFKDQNGVGHFSAKIQSMSQKPLNGVLSWSMKTWDGEILSANQREITTPSHGNIQEFQISLPAVLEEIKFIEAEFNLNIDGQDIPPAQACWLSPYQAKGDNRIEPDSPFGMGLYLCRYSGDSAGLSEMEKAAQMARAAGVKWSREDFSWSRIEPRQGQFEWDYYDNLIECAKLNGIQVYAIVCYWSNWTKPYTSEGVEDYIAYLRELVKRYHNDIHQWEIWNEPNIFFWQGTDELYAELLTKSYAAVKEIDPSAEVLGISTAGIDYDYISKMLQLGAPFDVLTIHPYRRVLRDDDFINDLIKASDLVKNEDGTRRPVWLTELGWSTYTPHNALKQSFIPMTLRGQADLIARCYLCSIVSGVEPRTFWYNFRNDGYDPIYFEHNMGIVTRDFKPKPAYQAYAALSQILHDKKFDKPIQLDDDALAYRFLSKSSNEIAIAAWNYEHDAMVRIPVNSESVTIINAIGEKKEQKITGNSVKIKLIKGSPIYITFQGTKQP
ncbi:MAG: beta-galactosidase [Candidatus Omnitrophica bacterium]|nr:beta-galactosidase [Candidatus Omnitrophota bacterium]